MSIAEKLTAVAENQQAVYEAGQKDGKAEANTLWINRTITELNDSDITSIGNYQFYNFTKLENVTLPSVTSVGIWGFRNCTSLRQIDIPLLKDVSDYSFRLVAAQSFDFPNATRIGVQAFYQASKLKELILRGDTVASLANVNAFAHTPIEGGTGYIYVPSALVDTYKAATNWSDFADQIRTIVTITQQPTDITVAVGDKARFEVTATGDGLTYQWYVNRNDGAGWVKNWSTYSYTDMDAKTSLNGNIYYCEITDSYGHVVRTNTVTLVVTE